MTVIRLENVSKQYKTANGSLTAVDNVNLTIQDSEIFGIIGYSGAGKSTMIRLLNGLEKPTEGLVEVNGVDISSARGASLRNARHDISMVFQHFNLLWSRTVAENIAFPLEIAGVKKSERAKRVKELIALVGLEGRDLAYPSQLSGGQKQRVGIARALANEPTMLLCDEATSALDPTTTTQILKLLKSINRELGITIVLITHEMEVVKDICDRMAIMQNGRVVESGSVYDIFANPENELTQEFIGSVVSFDIPPHIMQTFKGTIVKVLFKGDIAGQSIISDMLQQFEVRGNFLHGTIEYIQERPLGIFIMELIGDDADIHRATTYMESRGVTVEVQ